MRSGYYSFREKPGILSWLVIAAVIVVLDQLTKLWITKALQLGQKIEVTRFFNLVLAHNEGAAFSFLSSAGGWQRYFFTAISIIAILLILFFLKRNPTQKLFCWSLTLIMGGAVGNLVDRIVYGHVIDFLDVHAFGWHWPAFNIADSAITIGAVLFIIDEFRRVNKSN